MGVSRNKIGAIDPKKSMSPPAAAGANADQAALARRGSPQDEAAAPAELHPFLRVLGQASQLHLGRAGARLHPGGRHQPCPCPGALSRPPAVRPLSSQPQADRDGRGILPTLRQALDQIDQATEAIVASARNKTVVISCPMSLAENWLAGCMAAFRKKHPEIEVVLHGTIWEDLSEQIADITISTRRFDDRPPAGTMLWDDELVLLCAPDAAGGWQDARAAEGHAEGRLDLRARPPGMLAVHGRGAWHRHHRYEKGLTTNASNIALELAAIGAGFVATQFSLARAYLRRGLLVEPFPVRRPSPWTYYLTESQLSKGNVARTVKEWILAQARPRGRGPCWSPAPELSAEPRRRPAPPAGSTPPPPRRTSRRAAPSYHVRHLRRAVPDRPSPPERCARMISAASR